MLTKLKINKRKVYGFALQPKENNQRTNERGPGQIFDVNMGIVYDIGIVIKMPGTMKTVAVNDQEEYKQQAERSGCGDKAPGKGKLEQ